MTDSLDTSACRDGAMELSRAVHDALRIVVRMHESRGHVLCPACGRHLPRSVLYQLVEFHVHRSVNGAGRST